MATSRITHNSDVSYTLPDGVDDLVLTGTDPIDGTGNSLDNQIFGNNANNIIDGLDGNDTLYGGDGNDIVIGGNEDDQIDGGAGDDSLWGEAGDDSLNGDVGDDVLLGGDGFDNLFGGDGIDILDGGAGSDTMIGGAGDDLYQVDDFADIVIEQGATVEVAQRVSVDEFGSQANADSYGSVFSADGSKVLFHSWASNLITEDNNDVADVFIKDIATGEITRVSTNGADQEVNGESYAVAFSADGTKVLFTSNASNLVANDTNGKLDVFIKDLKTGEVTLVSTDGLIEGFNGDSEAVAISADGTKVLFNSDANNIVAGDTNNSTDAFIKDLSTGEIIRVSTDSGEKEARSGGFAVGLSADGTKVLFESSSADLVANDLNAKTDVFVKNIATSEVVRVSTNIDETEANGASEAYSISNDGTKVLFGSEASNLVV
ncbi:MAG: PD40 domain-containing protein, partial [Pseudomonadales bacterium]|nr:PD40 domain-containing protein [Pseudomonadales bacterium]